MAESHREPDPCARLGESNLVLDRSVENEYLLAANVVVFGDFHVGQHASDP